MSDLALRFPNIEPVSVFPEQSTSVVPKDICDPGLAAPNTTVFPQPCCTIYNEMDSYKLLLR